VKPCRRVSADPAGRDFLFPVWEKGAGTSPAKSGRRQGGATVKQWKWIVSAIVAVALVFGAFYGTAGAASSYQIEIDKTNNKLYLYKDGVVEKVYPVATGKTEDLTPEGTFPIVVKIVNPGWRGIPGGDPNNPLGVRWLGLSVNGDKGRTYGIHGTNHPESIGTHASHGCVRMAKDDLIELFNIVPEGTPVWIHKGASNGKWQGDPSFSVQPASGQVKTTMDKAKVRTGPSLGAFIIEQEKLGTVLDVTGFIKDWYQVKLPSGKTGFIHNSVVQKVTDVNQPTQTDQIKPASGMIKITYKWANIRSNPSLHAPILQKVKQGTRIPLTGEGKDWYQVLLSSGYKAYVHKSVAKKVNDKGTTQKQYVTVTVNLANIRQAPAQSATILMRVAQGTRLEKVGTNGDWYIVKLSDGRTGFIHNSVAH
jgi:uncharacterized protein YgiM (DUF1202 family)